MLCHRSLSLSPPHSLSLSLTSLSPSPSLPLPLSPSHPLLCHFSQSASTYISPFQLPGSIPQQSLTATKTTVAIVTKNISPLSRSICDEFMTIQKRAIKEPETSEELMEMTAFVEHARTIGMLSFNNRIAVRLPNLALSISYLLPAHVPVPFSWPFFSADLNEICCVSLLNSIL